MSTPPSPDMTLWLRRWQDGDVEARDVVFDLVYHELKRSAAGLFRNERLDHTLQPTALVHEACLRLFSSDGTPWQDRRHFFGIVARVMRQVLVDHSRERAALKRGGDRQRVDRLDDLAAARVDPDQVLALDQSLQRLETLDAKQARIVEARFFGGLSVDETSAYLDISPTSVKRHWRRARAWLHAELRTQGA
ncbi:MAG: ECF-type sigma factor [Acidobacteriota bacterium]